MHAAVPDPLPPLAESRDQDSGEDEFPESLGVDGELEDLWGFDGDQGDEDGRVWSPGALALFIHDGDNDPNGDPEASLVDEVIHPHAAEPDPFVVRGRWSSLALIDPVSAARVHAFYRVCGRISRDEKVSLAEVGSRLLPEGGQRLTWSVEEQYLSLTVMPRLLRPTAVWQEAIAEARVALTAEPEVKEARSALYEADAELRAAEAEARATRRLWGRWTDRHSRARARVPGWEAVRDEAVLRAARAQGRERLAEQLPELAEVTANVISARGTGLRCVGRFEEEIGWRDVGRMAAGLVIGQAGVGLMLSDLVDGSTLRRLLEPWNEAISTFPRLVEATALLVEEHAASPGNAGSSHDERAGQVQSDVAHSWSSLPQPSPAAIATPAQSPAPRPSSAEGSRESDGAPGHAKSSTPPGLATSVAPLAELLELASQADGMTRISYRDQIAAHGRLAIEPLGRWLADARLEPFAARTLERIAHAGHPEEVKEALQRGMQAASTAAARDDIQSVIDKLEPEVTVVQTLAWMRSQPAMSATSEWQRSDATRVIAKVDKVDAHRTKRGLSPLGERGRLEAVSLQMSDLRSEPYLNHCWAYGCGGRIDSRVNARCDGCKMFICESCGACMCRD
ncbi:MAG: hypothetical protein ACYDAN_10885 [Candidatus Limnocylindrales bacterium]